MSEKLWQKSRLKKKKKREKQSPETFHGKRVLCTERGWTGSAGGAAGVTHTNRASPPVHTTPRPADPWHMPPTEPHFSEVSDDDPPNRGVNERVAPAQLSQPLPSCATCLSVCLSFLPSSLWLVAQHPQGQRGVKMFIPYLQGVFWSFIKDLKAMSRWKVLRGERL